MDVDALLAQIHWVTVIAAAIAAIIATVASNMITWMRYRREHRLQNRTQYVLRRMMKNRRIKFRLFSTLQLFIPLPDQELREELIRIGAVRVSKADGDVLEKWQTLENARDQVFPKTKKTNASRNTRRH